MKIPFKIVAIVALVMLMQGCVFSPPVYEHKEDRIGSTTTKTDSVSATQRLGK